MDITHLQYFKIIAECGSLTKAAEILHISQPAMSAMLKKLEEDLGVALFDRGPNRIHLNRTGEAALVHVNTILRNVEQMQADLLATAQQNITLRIAFCDPGVRWFSVPRFSVAHPEIQVKDELYEGSDPAKLLAERMYDIVVTPAKIQAPGIACQPFLPDRVFLSVPSGSSLAGSESVSLKDVPAQPLLYPQIGGYFLSQIESLIIRDNLPITLVKNEFPVTQHLIRTTHFLATVSTLSRDLRNDGTHRTLVPLRDPELNVLYHVSYRKSEKGKNEKFLTWCKKIEEGLQEQE